MLEEKPRAWAIVGVGVDVDVDVEGHAWIMSAWPTAVPDRSLPSGAFF